MDVPGARRATANVQPLFRGTGASAGVVIGTTTSVRALAGKWKPGAVMPTTCRIAEPRRIDRPTTVGSLPNRSRQKALDSTTTGGAPEFAFSTSDGASGIGDFKIDPFTQFQFLNQNSELLLNGGTVKAGDSWFPGAQSNTGLTLLAAGTASTFTLKEIAIPTPLPAAAWTGLTGLGMVVLARATKVARKIA